MSKANQLTAQQLAKVQDVYAPFADAKIGVACLQADGTFLAVNQQIAQTLGYLPNELIGQSAYLYHDEDKHSQMRARLKSLFNSAIGSYNIRREFTRRDLSKIIFSTSVSAIKDDDGQVIAGIMVFSSVTTDKVSPFETKSLTGAIESSGSAVLVTNAEGTIEFANARFCDITGYVLSEIIGKTPSIIRSEETPPEVYINLWETILAQRQWRGSLINKRKDGSHYWAYQSIAPITNEDGVIVNIVSVSDDISNIKAHETRMEQLAFYDPLTELANRRKFRDDLNVLIKSSDQEKNSALLLLDLDHFKKINDTLGHDIGDELLVSIANRLRFCANNDISIYRLGGDEFTLLIKEADHIKNIKDYCHEVISLLAQPIHIGPHELTITVTIGISLIHKDANEASALQKNADIALYQAKKDGRNRFAFYEPYMDYEIKKALSLEHDLRHAIDNKGLSVKFQPLLDLATGDILGVETLCRWNHPIHGEIEPEYFIARAEESGLIHDLGKWVIQEACQALKNLVSAGFNEIFVSVNVSAKQFEDANISQFLQQAATEVQVPTHQLCVEITEAVLLEEIGYAMQSMHEIKSMGFKLAIDDFGTGFSSLSYLNRMPVDTLKIDRSFVENIPEDKGNSTVTSMVILMAEKLGLNIVAEGIENKHQQDFLLQHHCYAGQGYLYSKPLSEVELFEQLKNNFGCFLNSKC